MRDTFNYRIFFIHEHQPQGAPPLPAPTPAAPAPGVDLLHCREPGGVVATWAGLHDGLQALVDAPAAQPHFIDRLLRLEAHALHTLARHGDDSLFLLVQMLTDPGKHYNIVHAWLCAALCHLVAAECGLDGPEKDALTRAALTMNIAMSSLHLQLSGQQARQVEPSAEQRQRILNHPRQGASLLQELGVDDPQWLRCVTDHHERPDGRGYPAGKRDPDLPTRLLQLCDVFVGRISPRRYRAGIAAQQAMRGLCLNESLHPDLPGAALIRAVGIHIPGSHVLLANGEIAIVMRRGQHAHTPLVIALLGRKGAPLAVPLVRDTTEAAFRIVGGIASDEVRLRPSPARLLAWLHGA